MPMEWPLSVQVVIVAMPGFYETFIADWRPEFYAIHLGLVCSAITPPGP